MPLYETSSSCEHQLKILFHEAHALEQRAGQGKAGVERAKARATKAQLKFDNMKKLFVPATGYLSPLHPNHRVLMIVLMSCCSVFAVTRISW
jgi:hypothetical protein